VQSFSQLGPSPSSGLHPTFAWRRISAGTTSRVCLQSATDAQTILLFATSQFAAQPVWCQPTVMLVQHWFPEPQSSGFVQA
jgi:hypothetical protein